MNSKVYAAKSEEHIQLKSTYKSSEELEIPRKNTSQKPSNFNLQMTI